MSVKRPDISIYPSCLLPFRLFHRAGAIRTRQASRPPSSHLEGEAKFEASETEGETERTERERERRYSRKKGISIGLVRDHRLARHHTIFVVALLSLSPSLVPSSSLSLSLLARYTTGIVCTSFFPRAIGSRSLFQPPPRPRRPRRPRVGSAHRCRSETPSAWTSTCLFLAGRGAR